jgi:alpha-beta hydrolase superfamily lysophospholipase
MKEEKLDGAGGLGLFIRSWRPPGKVRGVVCIVHGFNSHSGHYLWAAEQLVATDLAVYALDLRGRGRSAGERYYISKFADYQNDVHLLVSVATSREEGKGVFLLGHSAGGVIACVYALDHQAELAGLICESFAFEVPAPGLALAAIKGLSRLAPRLRVLKLPNPAFSRDPAVVEALNNDPLIADEVQPAQTVTEMVRANERLRREFPLLKLPVLIIHGTEDSVTKPSGSQFFHDTAGSADNTLKLYQGYFHDPLNDLGKEAVMDDINAWINARLPVW